MVKKKVSLKSTEEQLKTKHYIGLPPELTGGIGQRISLHRAKFLVIEETEEGFYIFRYTDCGEFVGDTWHKNLDDAFKQAEYEYGIKKYQWEDIPSEVVDWYYYIFQKSEPK